MLKAYSCSGGRHEMELKRWLLGLAGVTMCGAVSAEAQTGRQVGPPGGTVISRSADPNNVNKMYLGTADGHVFTSADEGSHWQLLSRIGFVQADVVTYILVDPRNANRL